MAAHIVLAGGGHANMLALLQLARQWPATGRLTLVSESAATPYSGMLPGHIAGSYASAQCFIDLARTAQACGAEFVAARVEGVEGKQLLLDGGQRLAFDVLSINTGATPPPVAGAAACNVKPIAAFMQWLDSQQPQEFKRLAVVGGGAGGVETILALAHRWPPPRPALLLVAERLLPAATAAMRRHVRQRLAACGIEIVPARAVEYADGHLHLSDGQRLPVCRVVYATAVAASEWFARTGLPLDGSGFIQVNGCLQSPAAANIFISGDAAAHRPPLPKSGVMAVRQAETLARNLPVAAGWRAGRLVPFGGSAQALYILGDGDGKGAVASRNGITVRGRWVWRWKQYLDSKFMAKFQ